MLSSKPAERHTSTDLEEASAPPCRRTRRPRWKTRLDHHIILAALSITLTGLLMHAFPKRDLISRISIATAYPALLLTGIALLLGPLNVLRSRPNPVSFDLRRDVGIWAGLLALIHTGFGLNVHLRGRMWLYFVDEHLHIRHNLFGIGNYTGVIAALLFLMLVFISNDLSLRRLGKLRWKSLQQWSYVAAGLTVAHAALYQQVENRVWVYRLAIYVVTLLVISMQLIGFARRRRILN